mgnify:FL=1
MVTRPAPTQTSGTRGRKGDQPGSPHRFNAQVAAAFRECADLLKLQKANPFRINAYVRAAATLESLDFDVRELLDAEGVEGLVRLQSIGRGPRQ